MSLIPGEMGPVAGLDPVRRLRVMAAATPGCVLLERFVAAPFDVVWAVAADLENELPRYQPFVRTVRVTPRGEDRLDVRALGNARLSADFDAVLRSGWCWMQSRHITFGLAATPVPGGTLVGRAGSTRRRPLRRLAVPVLRRAFARELDRFEARVQARRRDDR
ncbi:SRPBCC family protein [Sphaerisporangium fuscum]|uniref:SRPBCC family protein n=1 Tax=Sphaerisporangium fuscum TaxID=2835868 RepID=UPI001BDCB1F7|nr:SRPBCC family protein [Sphaerisporangium fuscum]